MLLFIIINLFIPFFGKKKKKFQTVFSSLKPSIPLTFLCIYGRLVSIHIFWVLISGGLPFWSANRALWQRRYVFFLPFSKISLKCIEKVRKNDKSKHKVFLITSSDEGMAFRGIFIYVTGVTCNVMQGGTVQVM